MPAPTASITIAALTDGVTAIATDQIPVNRAGADRYITPGYIETMISATNISTGTLPSARGGTGVSNAGTITNASNTTITGGGTIALGGFTLTVPATGSAALLATANVFTATQAIAINDAGTNTTTTLATLTHNSSGTPAASFGTRLLFNLDSATVDDRNAASQDVIWTTATDATRTSAIVFSVVSSAAALGEALRIGVSLGVLGISGISGSTSAFLTKNTISLDNTTGVGLFTNAGAGAGTNVTIRASGTIAASQFVAFQFAAVETARFDVASAAASSAAVVDNLILRRNPTSGTPAAGTGQQLRFTGMSSTTNNRDQLTLSTEWVVATEASQTTLAKFSIYDTAAREAMRMQASGSAAMIGFLGAAAVVRQTGGADLTNNVTSGGSSDTITNWTDLTVYATDAAAIRNAVYQLARTLKQDHDALRLYGLLT